MYSDEDIHYALETTSVLREPDRRIDTFGATSFQFHLVSELMDSVDKVRVREGKIEAARPTILRPDPEQELTFDGFGEQAEAFADFFKRHAQNVAFLKYGFNFRRDKVTETVSHAPFVEVCERITGEVEASGNPLSAVIRGVDDTWEICLLKFTMEMIEKSQGINIFDFKRKGLI